MFQWTTIFHLIFQCFRDINELPEICVEISDLALVTLPDDLSDSDKTNLQNLFSKYSKPVKNGEEQPTSSESNSKEGDRNISSDSGVATTSTLNTAKESSAQVDASKTEPSSTNKDASGVNSASVQNAEQVPNNAASNEPIKAGSYR